MKEIFGEPVEIIPTEPQRVRRNEKFASAGLKVNLEQAENVICPEIRIQQRRLVPLT